MAEMLQTKSVNDIKARYQRLLYDVIRIERGHAMPVRCVNWFSLSLSCFAFILTLLNITAMYTQLQKALLDHLPDCH